MWPSMQPATPVSLPLLPPPFKDSSKTTRIPRVRSQGARREAPSRCKPNPPTRTVCASPWQSEVWPGRMPNLSLASLFQPWDDSRTSFPCPCHSEERSSDNSTVFPKGIKCEKASLTSNLEEMRGNYVLMRKMAGQNCKSVMMKIYRPTHPKFDA
ncbi:uncharacterized protein LOC144234326 isoform X2 [Crocuta crocuta]